MNIELSRLESLRDGDGNLSVDELLHLLSNHEIRVVIAFLYTQPDTTVDELAAILTATTAAEKGSIGTSSDYENARIRLHHDVLPRLDDCGFLEFDPETGTVTETDVPTPVYDCLGLED